MAHFQYTRFHINNFASPSWFHLGQLDMSLDSRWKAPSMLQIFLVMSSKFTWTKPLTCFPLLTYWESSIELYRNFYLFYYKWKPIKYSDWSLSWRKTTSLWYHFKLEWWKMIFYNASRCIVRILDDSKAFFVEHWLLKRCNHIWISSFKLF